MTWHLNRSLTSHVRLYQPVGLRNPTCTKNVYIWLASTSSNVCVQHSSLSLSYRINATQLHSTGRRGVCIPRHCYSLYRLQACLQSLDPSRLVGRCMGSNFTHLRRCLPGMHLDPLDRFTILGPRSGFNLRFVGSTYECHCLHHPNRQPFWPQGSHMDHSSYCGIICVHVGRAVDSEGQRVHIPCMSDVRACGNLATDHGHYFGFCSRRCATASFEKYRAFT